MSERKPLGWVVVGHDERGRAWVVIDASQERSWVETQDEASITCGEMSKARFPGCTYTVEPIGSVPSGEREAREEVAKLRAALERLFPVDEGYTEAFDDLEAMGLLVEVPADEAFREEWDADTMYVWAWSALASRPGTEGA